MKKLFTIGLITISIVLNSCSNGQGHSSETNLPATEFAVKIKELPDAQIIDVRTPAEFSKGHLQNAVNIDWNGNDFDKQISVLDKSQPVFVYCLSGGRSFEAANKMQSAGFKELYQLTGGLMKWKAANLAETTNNLRTTTGLTREQFYMQLNPGKLVLVDFYADWCAPCKQMKPYIDEISKDMADKVVVIRINADDNPALCEELKIEALPVLQNIRRKVSLDRYNVGNED